MPLLVKDLGTKLQSGHHMQYFMDNGIGCILLSLICVTVSMLVTRIVLNQEQICE